MDNGNGNGEHGVEHVRVDVLTLTLQRDPWMLKISGEVESDAVALAMLRQAMACYEARERQAYAVAAIQQAQEAQRVAELVKRATQGNRGS